MDINISRASVVGARGKQDKVLGQQIMDGEDILEKKWQHIWESISKSVQLLSVPSPFLDPEKYISHYTYTKRINSAKKIFWEKN